MSGRRDKRALLVGTICLGVSLTTAWAVGRGGDEPSPAEELLDHAALAPEGADEIRWDLTETRNERVDFWINYLKGNNKQRMQLWLERSGRYVPMIQEELRRRDMPEDLIYLALIESGFSPRAVSTAKAVGIWQFIPETGRRYGLEVSQYVDERRDPIKSTDAALRYLTDLHKRFGSWYLAAAGYNTGENRVERILRERAGGAKGDDALFWKIDQYLPRETRDYVPLMLAAGHIGKEPAKYGFEGIAYQDPLNFEEVQVPGGTGLATVARAAGVSKAEVVDLNPHLLREMTPPGRAWAVRIPNGARPEFAQNFPRLHQEERLAAQRAAPRAAPATVASAAPSSSAAAARTHTVRRGETLSGIAQRYGTSVSALRAANGNVAPTRLRAGQRLRVPASGRTVVATRQPQSAAPAAVRYHQVRNGESLWAISRRYNTSVAQLQRLNNLRSGSTIHPGQRIRVRA
jgi:membrane-bound lytic murein transglycosylase D